VALGQRQSEPLAAGDDEIHDRPGEGETPTRRAPSSAPRPAPYTPY
jgi:hypothetical protein